MVFMIERLDAFSTEVRLALGKLSASAMTVLALITSLLVGALSSYVVYQRYLHPLGRFPGPFWASLTGLWKIRVLLTGDMPAQLCKLHEKYGNIIRIGPNELSFNTETALNDIYKAGRVMEKGPLYDGFTSFKPNVFGLREEDVRESPYERKNWLTDGTEARFPKTPDGPQLFQDRTQDHGSHL